MITRMTSLALATVALGGCVESRDAITGTQSLRIDLKSPVPGGPMSRLLDNQRTIVVDVSALGVDNLVDTSYHNAVQVYVNFLGTLTPYLGGTPLATIQLTAGVAKDQTVMLPPVFGPTTLWFDDGASPNATFAAGASPVLWYRDPFIRDIQQPLDEMALDALGSSPLEQKQVSVRTSRHGETGRLVVTSVFAQGYTVSDVSCGASGAPPCATGDYDHMMVFSFSAPRDERGCLIKEGQAIDGFAGGVSEFNGLTEIGFPQTFVERPAHTDCGDDEIDVNSARLPPPTTFESTWFTNRIMFERNEAAPIAIVNAKVCNLDMDYDRYKQWKLDPTGTGGNCMGNRNVLNVITSGIVAGDDVRALEGKVVPRVVGVLRPVNIGSFNVWIIYPRSMADLTLQ
jgi:hypothetical protein